MLEPGPQVRQEQPYCLEEPLDADLRHRERSEREATIGPHRSGVGYDGRHTYPFLLKKKKTVESGKDINGRYREKALEGAEFQRGAPISEK